ncbi:CbiQ family ECF transporter T component [Limnohabitans sp.]|uniref:CbiQ family ECF transporter T component n=1 Tax=Limnohabitans sp. TaxID=1907725 RepID=UPI0038BD9344
MGSLYSEHRTWLHSVPAGVKLWVLALVGAGLFFTDRVEVLLPSTVLCLAMFVSLGRATLGARKLLVALAVSCALVVGFHAVMQHPMLGVTSAMRLLSTALMGVALTLTTRYTALLDVFESWLWPLRTLGFRVDRLALMLALMLRFVEHFFVLWQRLDDAHRVRTGRSGGWRLLAPLTIQMLQAANRVADTLELRLGK